MQHLVVGMTGVSRKFDGLQRQNFRFTRTFSKCVNAVRCEILEDVLPSTSRPENLHLSNLLSLAKAYLLTKRIATETAAAANSSVDFTRPTSLIDCDLYSSANGRSIRCRSDEFQLTLQGSCA